MPLSRRRKRWGRAFYWLLAVAGLVLVAWIVHKSARIAPPAGSVPPAGSSLSRSNLVTRDQRKTLATAPPSAPWLTPTNHPPAPLRSADLALTRPRRVELSPEEILSAQLALTWQGISSGSLDGVAGLQTRAALRAFQQREGLAPTGELDEATRARLVLNLPLYSNYIVTTNDLLRLQPVSPTWLGKSQQTRLDYENILELVAETTQAHPELIRQLNPGLDWNAVAAGASLRVPNARYPPPRAKAAFVRVRLAEKILEAFDPSTNLLAHFPCSIARRVEKRPVGELYVASIVLSPNYRFHPDIFPESEEARQLGRPLTIPPGPNNPVGTAWIGLTKPGYGIHGTPHPEEIGRSESHGCFRLANWNAEYLAKLVEIGTRVQVEP